jgi:hypothetical protein
MFMLEGDLNEAQKFEVGRSFVIVCSVKSEDFTPTGTSPRLQKAAGVLLRICRSGFLSFLCLGCYGRLQIIRADVFRILSA